MAGAPYSPTTSANVKRWAPLFNPGGTSGLYVNHLAQEFQILDIATAWYDNSILDIAKDICNIQDLSVKFDNFIFKEVSVALILQECLGEEFGRLFYFPFVFSIRVQSEGPLVKRATSTDRLLGKSPIIDQALIAIRDIGGDDRLVLKPRARKNTRRNSILTRPFFCSINIIAGKGLCPVRDFWPAVRRATDIGPPLFFWMEFAGNLNHISEFSLSSIEVKDADRYSLRGFRRVCIVEIKRSGSAPALSSVLEDWPAPASKPTYRFKRAEKRY